MKNMTSLNLSRFKIIFNYIAHRLFVRIIVLYLLFPLLIFDFFSVAVPTDEETHNGNKVAIGPKPRSWVPFISSDLDVPGGYSFNTNNWPFVVWKPICIIYLRIRGFEKPIEWRQ